MFTTDQENKINDAVKKVDEMYEYFQQQKLDGKMTAGLNYIGRTNDTTPTGGIIIETQEGPVTLLRA